MPGAMGDSGSEDEAPPKNKKPAGRAKQPRLWVTPGVLPGVTISFH